MTIAFQTPATRKLRPGWSSVTVIPLAVLAYGLSLHWAYANIIQPQFAYTGRAYERPDLLLAVASWLIAAAAAAPLPRRIAQPSNVVLWILYVVVIAPAILMGTYLAILEGEGSLVLSVGFALAFTAVCLFTRRATPAKPLLTKRVSTTTFWLAIIGFSALMYGTLAAISGLSFNLVSIYDVYDVREEYADALAGGGLLGYLVSAQANVVNPLVIARGIYARNRSLVALGLLGQLVIYSETGFKTVLLSVPAILIVTLIFRASTRPRGITFLWGAVGIVFVSTSVDAIQNSIVWTSIFVRRFLTTPATLSHTYVDYYGRADSFEMLSHSVLAPWFIDPPHSMSPPKTIGLALSGSPEMSANANLFADGYAHFGWVGVGIAAILLIAYLRFLDRAAAGIPIAAASLIVLMPAITLANTSILVAMLSHGLVALVILLAISPDEWGSTNGREPRAAP